MQFTMNEYIFPMDPYRHLLMSESKKHFLKLSLNKVDIPEH